MGTATEQKNWTLTCDRCGASDDSDIEMLGSLHFCPDALAAGVWRYRRLRPSAPPVQVQTCPHGMTMPWSEYWGPCQLCEPAPITVEERVPTDKELLDWLEDNERSVEYTGNAVKPWRVNMRYHPHGYYEYQYGETVRDALRAALLAKVET